MRFLILSDIHGNAIALKEILKQIDKYNIDEIIWCGDYVTDFPYSHETIELIHSTAEYYKSHIILGNRDMKMVDWARGKKFIFSEVNNGFYTFKQLTEDDIKWIASLPEKITITLPKGEIIYVSHYLDENYIENCKYKLFGHTHKQIVFENDGVMYINPGSVGITTDEIIGAQFAILDTEMKKVEKYTIQYDTTKLIEDIKKTPIYNDDVQWGKLIEKGLLSEIDYPMNCVMEYQRLSKENNTNEGSIELWQIALNNTLN